ncbi:antirestriction protein [Microcystis phage MaeS]|nr:antirestriction protein [Microcystis phage MaeS]
MTVETLEIKVYVANLGKYNEGELVGDWFTLPTDFEEIAKKIGLNEQYEEYAIHDYEAPKGIKISEYSNISKLNEIAEQLETLESYQAEEISYLVATGELDFEEALEKLQNSEYRIFHDCNDMSDVAYEIVEEQGLLNSLPENLRYYFDYEKYGRDLEIEGSFYYVGRGVYVELFN